MMPPTRYAYARLALGLALGLSASPAIVATVCGVTLAPAPARADEALPATGSSPVTEGSADELQQLVEQTASAYDEAVAARADVEARIAETQARIDELNAQLPSLRETAAAAMRTSYKLQQGGMSLVELLVSADDFSSFIATLQYLSSVQGHSSNQIDELTAAVSELDTRSAELAEQHQAALEREDEAAQALAAAQDAREQAARRAQEQAEAQRAAEGAALAAQQQAAAQQAQAQRAQIVESSAPEGAAASEDAATPAAAEESEASPAPSAGEADDSDSTGWDADKATFVASWGARIDAYLAGSALAGQGSTFAAAAWDYGVDPRFSPAIAFVESTLGAYCFLPHNAWGWGSASWGSWEEAIYAHVAGLARIYGSGLTYDAARTYCPSNADFWYAAVLGQMESI